MSDFDPIRAMREEVAGLFDVQKVIRARAREAEKVLAEAEADHNALLKLDAFTNGLLNSARARLKALEDQAGKEQQ